MAIAKLAIFSDNLDTKLENPIEKFKYIPQTLHKIEKPCSCLREWKIGQKGQYYYYYYYYVKMATDDARSAPNLITFKKENGKFYYY